MYLQDLFGWFTLFIIFIITYFIIKKDRKIANFMLVALILRSIFVILDEYYVTLPGSTMDAIVFENKANYFSEVYGIKIIFEFSQDSYNLSRFISIFYTLLDRSPFMAKMISVGFGIGTVLLIYHFTFILWGSRAALKAGWLATFFPSLILYSCLILREIYICFFLSYALIGCVNYIRNKKKIDLVKLSISFLLASNFHGPIIIGLFCFYIFIIFQILKENNFFIRFKKKNTLYVFLIPILLFPIVAYFLGLYSIPKLGYYKDLYKTKISGNKIIEFKISEKLIWKINKATRSTDKEIGAKYPIWITPENTIELIYLTPIRMFYFLYSPFPWDVKKLKHMIGLIESFFYLYLTYCILSNKKILNQNPQTRFLIILLILYIFIYSFGVGNFGASIRHRLKFVMILIAIAAPKITNIRFNKFK